MQDELIALILAAVPGVFFVWVAARLARSASEAKPWWLFVLLFLWGAFPMISIAKWGNTRLNGLMHYDVDAGLSTAEQVAAAELILGLMGPLMEETLKALPLVAVFLLAGRYFQTVRDGMYYAAAVGLGFGIAENQLYIHSAVMNSRFGIVVGVTVTRTLIFGINHVIWCTPLAVALAKVRDADSRTASLTLPFLGFVFGVLMHGLHNASFLWVQLQRSYGVYAVIVSLTIYAVAYITWLVIALRTKRSDTLPLLDEPSKCST